MLKIGIDVGSTTMKVVALDDGNNVVYGAYERHYSEIFYRAGKMLADLRDKLGDQEITYSISGSAGMGLSEEAGIPFVQEVYATRVAAMTYMPDTDAIIELGGEDAKILFLGIWQRQYSQVP